jgi:hypothetical protein
MSLVETGSASYHKDSEVARMYRSAVVFGLYLSFALAIGAACSNGSGPQVPDFLPGAGGSTSGSGGTTGGSLASGGTTGGTNTTGGTTGGTNTTGGTTGGTNTTGGTTGGTNTTGGTGGSAGHATGGTGGTTGGGTATGGTGGTTGGTVGTTGGTGGTGGTTGGSTATGGTTSGGAGTGSGTTCDTAFAVGNDGFVRMPAKDGSCWHGYAYGAGNSCTSTGCTGTTTIEYCGDTTATGFSTCKGVLSISGMLQSSVSPDYAGFVLIGFSTNEPAGGGTKGTVTPTGTGIVVTGSAAGGRVQLQNGSTYYCATFTSGTVIPYTSFNTKCYDTPPDGVAYAKGPIDTVALQIPGGAATAAYTVSITSVKEM